MDNDVTVKRAIFIQNSVNVRTAFGWASPVDVLTAVKLHCTAFYGCMLWDLGSQKAGTVYSSYNTAVRLLWSCPRQTKTFLVQKVLSSGHMTAKTDILARYGNYFHSMLRSASLEVRVMARLVSRDLRTVTARNLKMVEQLSGLDPWQFGGRRLKDAIHLREEVEVERESEWRVNYLHTLLSRRMEAHYKHHTEEEEWLQKLIDSLVL